MELNAPFGTLRALALALEGGSSRSPGQFSNFWARSALKHNAFPARSASNFKPIEGDPRNTPLYHDLA